MLAHDPHPQSRGEAVWAKCDMIAVVGFDRLRGWYSRWNGKRQYQTILVGLEDLRGIRAGVLHGRGFGQLADQWAQQAPL